MLSRKEQAVELFRNKYNSSQAVFAAYRNPEAMSESAALRVATCFGGGVACTGQGLCGAVSGALLAISSKHGRGTGEPIENKSKTYALGKRFMQEFASRMGSCNCSDITGPCLGEACDTQKADSSELSETTCLNAVKTAAELLEVIY